MISLQILFRTNYQFSIFEFFYFFGEYYFAFWLWKGLMCYPNKKIAVAHLSKLFFIFSFFLSLLITKVNQLFGDKFSLHALVFALLLLPSCWVILRMKLPIDFKSARFFTLGALLSLFFMFVANAFSWFSAEFVGNNAANIYTAYQSVFDVLVELLLAFGLVLLAAVSIQSRLRRNHHLLQAERDKMMLLAHRDPLTDCFNRHALNQLTPRFNRESGLLIIIDINNLKLINDQYGHQIGDLAIQQVAASMKDFLRSNDYLFRFGGDEFLLISFGLSLEDGQKRMQEIQLSLHHQTNPKLQSIELSVSWGMRNFDEELSFDEVMPDADKQLYNHKQMSRV